jgi:hypothetical protein
MATDQLEVETRDNYRWVALTNTTAAVFMSALDGSIVIISLLRSSGAFTWIRSRPPTSPTCCG